VSDAGGQAAGKKREERCALLVGRDERRVSTLFAAHVNPKIATRQ
jgi:hypothetical protein